MDADTIKHLDYVQSAISRMADASFKIKGLAITVVSAFVGIYVKTKDIHFLLVIILPLILFWILDSYYLQQERKFRALYDILIGKETHYGSVRKFEMPLDKIKGGQNKFISAMFSITEWGLYAGLGGLLLIYCGILKCKACCG